MSAFIGTAVPPWWLDALVHIRQAADRPEVEYQILPQWWPTLYPKAQALARELNAVAGVNHFAKWEYSEQSLLRLSHCHPVLVLVMLMALPRSPLDIGILEGARTIEKQRKNMESGASRTMDSYHIPRELMPKHPGVKVAGAVDFIVYENGKRGVGITPYQTVWEEAIRPAVLQIKASLTWGMAWDTPNSPEPTNKPGSLMDGHHLELDRKRYPTLKPLS